MSILYSGQNRKNAIINGNFNIWQRGTLFTGIAGTTYSADRFKYLKGGGMVHDITRDTDVPSSVNANYSLKMDCTTADAAIAAGDYLLINQKIEGYNFLPFVGKTATLSFWVKATKPGIYCISFGNSGSDRSYVSEYTINSANTWEKKTITITFDYSGGTWDYTNGIGLDINWVIASGSTFQTTADAWQSGSYFATSNQVNGCDNTDNNFWLSQVQLELGAEATEFEHLPIDQEIAMCQRYYEKSYDLTVDPGTVDIAGAPSIILGSGLDIETLIITFKSTKRNTPNITLYDHAGNEGKVTVNAGNNKNGSYMQVGENNFTAGVQFSADADLLLSFHYTADAEL